MFRLMNQGQFYIQFISFEVKQNESNESQRKLMELQQEKERALQKTKEMNEKVGNLKDYGHQLSDEQRKLRFESQKVKAGYEEELSEVQADLDNMKREWAKLERETEAGNSKEEIERVEALIAKEAEEFKDSKREFGFRMERHQEKEEDITMRRIKLVNYVEDEI